MDQLASSSRPSDARARLAQALVEVAAGNKAALSEVYQRTSAKLFGICLRILGDRGEAEDILHDVYLLVWRKAGSFDASRASPITWLATLARNRAIDRLRASGTRRTVPVDAALDVPDGREDALTGLERAEGAERLGCCLEELDPRPAAAIRAAFFGGFTYVELAEREGVPLGTMKSWVRRALLRLRECLER